MLAVNRNEPSNHGKRRTLNAYFKVKQVNMKKLHNIWFQPVCYSGKGKTVETDQWGQEGWMNRQLTEDFSGQ